MSNTTYKDNLATLHYCKTNTNHSSIPIWYRCANISPQATEILSRRKKPSKLITNNLIDIVPDNLAI